MTNFKSLPYKSLRLVARCYGVFQNRHILPPNPLNLKKPHNSKIIKVLIKVKMYAHINDFDSDIKKELKFFIENYNDLDCFQTPREMGNILKFIKKTEGIQGNIIELGTGKGGTSIMITRYLKSLGSKRIVYACDTFQGLPYEDRFSDIAKEKIIGRYNYSFDLVSSQVKKYGVQNKIKLVKGLFKNTLNLHLSSEKFSYAFVDCDLYDSTNECLGFVWQRMNRNGIVQFDEYGGHESNVKRNYWGETKAVDEFCERHNISIQSEPEPFIVK